MEEKINTLRLVAKIADKKQIEADQTRALRIAKEAERDKYKDMDAVK